MDHTTPTRAGQPGAVAPGATRGISESRWRTRCSWISLGLLTGTLGTGRKEARAAVAKAEGR